MEIREVQEAAQAGYTADDFNIRFDMIVKQHSCPDILQNTNQRKMLPGR